MDLLKWTKREVDKIKQARQSKEKIEQQILSALRFRFPGLKAKFTINQDDSFDFKMLPGSKERFDELYPGMNQKQADKQILEDMKTIILKYMPNAQFESYDRYGKHHSF